MNVEITELTIDAYDEVFALWQQSEGVGLSDADARGAIFSYLRRNPGMSFVAKDDGAVVGVVLCGHDGRRGYIHHCAVRASLRGQGIGRRLVERSLDALQRAGIQKCHLFIFNDNRDAMAFWHDAGWTLRTDISVMSKDM